MCHEARRLIIGNRSQPLFVALAVNVKFASWTRDDTLSFMNTLRKWYSTVLGLRNSWLATLRLLAPPATSFATRSS